jgi:crossover junction endodeoxyribonuclease RuvC
MLCLGIDPGTARIGFGLVREHVDGALEAVDYGVIVTKAKRPMWERLGVIYDQITDLIQRHQPDRAGVEELFFAKNVTTAITVAQGRGVILLALAQAGLEIAEYKPNQIKQAISGYGGATKSQMQEMTKVLLGLESIPKPDDAADGLAVAITDLHSMRYTSLY